MAKKHQPLYLTDWDSTSKSVNKKLNNKNLQTKLKDHTALAKSSSKRALATKDALPRAIQTGAAKRSREVANSAFTELLDRKFNKSSKKKSK